jgi:hypothetical protein
VSWIGPGIHWVHLLKAKQFVINDICSATLNAAAEDSSLRSNSLGGLRLDICFCFVVVVLFSLNMFVLFIRYASLCLLILPHQLLPLHTMSNGVSFCDKVMDISVFKQITDLQEPKANTHTPAKELLVHLSCSSQTFLDTYGLALNNMDKAGCSALHDSPHLVAHLISASALQWNVDMHAHHCDWKLLGISFAWMQFIFLNTRGICSATVLVLALSGRVFSMFLSQLLALRLRRTQSLKILYLLSTGTLLMGSSLVGEPSHKAVAEPLAIILDKWTKTNNAHLHGKKDRPAIRSLSSWRIIPSWSPQTLAQRRHLLTFVLPSLLKSCLPFCLPLCFVSLSLLFPFRWPPITRPASTTSLPLPNVLLPMPLLTDLTMSLTSSSLSTCLLLLSLGSPGCSTLSPPTILLRSVLFNSHIFCHYTFTSYLGYKKLGFAFNHNTRILINPVHSPLSLLFLLHCLCLCPHQTTSPLSSTSCHLYPTPLALPTPTPFPLHHLLSPLLRSLFLSVWPLFSGPLSTFIFLSSLCLILLSVSPILPSLMIPIVHLSSSPLFSFLILPALTHFLQQLLGVTNDNDNNNNNNNGNGNTHCPSTRKRSALFSLLFPSSFHLCSSNRPSFHWKAQHPFFPRSVLPSLLPFYFYFPCRNPLFLSLLTPLFSSFSRESTPHQESCSLMHHSSCLSTFCRQS